MITPSTVDLTEADLPLWMRRARRGVDWGVLFALAFSLLAAWIFVATDGLPRTNDLERYVFRTAEYAESLREGQLFPRWSSSVHSGYGAPIPQFSPPAAGLIPALFTVLLTNDPILSVRLTIISAFLLAGGTTYAFVLRRTNAQTALIASALFVFSPALTMSVTLVEGSLPLMLAAAFLPMLLWSLDRLLAAERASTVLTVAISTALLCLSHVQLSILAIFIAVSYAIWQRLTQRRATKLRGALAALALGIGMAAPFWLPAANVFNLRWTPPQIQAQPLSLTDLVSVAQPQDTNALLPMPETGLGPGMLLCGAISLIALIASRQRSVFRVWALALLVILIMTLLILRPNGTWPLIAITWIGSLLASGVVDALPRLTRASRGWWIPLLTAGLILGGVPGWLFNISGFDEWDTDLQARLAFEDSGFGVPVSAADEAVPNSLPEAWALPDVATVTPRVTFEDPGADDQLVPLFSGIHSDRFQIIAPDGANLRILRAPSPAWAVTLNGQLVPVFTDPFTGIVRVSVEGAANGELHVYYAATQIEIVSYAVGALSLVTVILVAYRRRTKDDDDVFESLELLPATIARRTAVTVGSLLGILIILLVIGAVAAPFERYPRDLPSLGVRSEGGLLLSNYRISSQNLDVGESGSVHLIWRAQQTPTANQMVRLILVDTVTGLQRELAPPHAPGYYPTRRWSPGRYVLDRMEFVIPSDLTIGTYRFGVEILRCDARCNELIPEAILGAEGQAVTNRILLPPPVTIGR